MCDAGLVWECGPKKEEREVVADLPSKGDIIFMDDGFRAYEVVKVVHDFSKPGKHSHSTITVYAVRDV